MRNRIMLLIIVSLVACSSNHEGNKAKSQISRINEILQILDSISSSESLCKVSIISNNLLTYDVSELYDMIAKSEGKDGESILSLKKSSMIYERANLKNGDTLYIFDHIFIRPESRINLKTYAINSSHALMSYNGERAYRASKTSLNGLYAKGIQSQNPTVCDGSTYSKGYAFQVLIKNKTFIINKCNDIPVKSLPITNYEVMDSIIKHVYETDWLIQEIGNKSNEMFKNKIRNHIFNKFEYNGICDDIYFVEDINNYECWALWNKQELMYCYNGVIQRLSPPSIRLEQLFDNFNDDDISIVLSDKTINMFPHRKHFKSAFFVTKINIHHNNNSISYVKRFEGYF